MTLPEITRAEAARDVYHAIAQAADRGGKAPTNAAMAKQIGVATSTVWHAVGLLIAGGLIERRKICIIASRPKGGHQSAYRIISTGAATQGFSTGTGVAPPWPRPPRLHRAEPASVPRYQASSARAHNTVQTAK
tara:strand:+ start:7449 stop:7850 length:402 start_codon:yes stop_codon:yes gene_type:complete